jgi:hypothetical protein
VRVSLRVFPRDDAEWEGAVGRLLAGVEADDDDLVARVARDAEEELRARWPQARVRPQHPLASIQTDRVVYAFRDGWAVPPRHEPQPTPDEAPDEHGRQPPGRR